MSSQASFGSSMMFHSMNEDLNASLATADELSREFSSLLHEASASQPPPVPQYKSASLSSSSISSSTPATPTTPTTWETGGSSLVFSPISIYADPGLRSLDSGVSSSRNTSSPPVLSPRILTPPQIRREVSSTSPRPLSNPTISYGQLTPPNQSPHARRASSPSHHPPSFGRSARGSLGYMDPGRAPSPSPSYDQAPRSPMHPAPAMLSPYYSPPTGRRSPRPDRSPSPRPHHAVSSTLPRGFMPFRPTDEGTQRQKSPAKWNETDLDMSYEKKTNHTYDKTEWLRPSVPNSNWRESNLDGPPLASKKELLPSFNPSHASLPRNARISVPPDHPAAASSPYHPQSIISRIPIPPSSAQARQRRPIPLSVILRLQNPRFAAASTRYPRAPQEDGDPGLYHQAQFPLQPQVMTLPREYLYHLQPPPPELRQPAYYGEVLNPGDVDAELERLDPVHGFTISERGRVAVRGERMEAASPRPLSPSRLQPVMAPPRPLSPSRLQPVMAPQAQTQAVPDLEEVLRLRAEIPRALKRRGSIDQSSQAEKKAAAQPPNHYKQMINKLFHRKDVRHKGELGSENSSSSEGEESSGLPSPLPAPLTQTPIPPEQRGYHSILRRSHRERQGSASGCRARLSPLVLLLDGALVGELDTVQRAVQEMSDPSQPNDEGITALHNAICGGHYSVVDFLVRIGANVSAPDSHGWTPLHCAASCNDRPLCEFLVRNGAAVMAVTESDGATASQKCDPYAVGFEECETFLRGVEEAMGVENSGVLYALWSYPSQATDELSFKEGDMVTILQKAEGVDWWWASLCGREGFIPNNYFGLFPKVRPKSLC